jgi:integrase
MIEVRQLCQGLRRTLGTAPGRRKKALVREDLERVLAVLPADALGARDRAMILLGFAGAFRRSELAGLDVASVNFESRGLAVFLARSKTDQEGRGDWVGVSDGAKTFEALRAWLAIVGRTPGPLFRSFDTDRTLVSPPIRLKPAGVGKAIIRALEAAGVMEKIRKRKPAGEKRRNRAFGAHSLRAGYATQAKRDGKALDEIMGQARWRSHKQAMEYVRRESIFDNPGSRGVAL